MDIVTIKLTNPCETWPYLHMDESCKIYNQWQFRLPSLLSKISIIYSDNISVNTPSEPGSASLESRSIWGILRGLETLSQIIIPGDNDGEVRN